MRLMRNELRRTRVDRGHRAAFASDGLSTVKGGPVTAPSSAGPGPNGIERTSA